MATKYILPMILFFASCAVSNNGTPSSTDGSDTIPAAVMTFLKHIENNEWDTILSGKSLRILSTHVEYVPSNLDDSAGQNIKNITKNSSSRWLSIIPTLLTKFQSPLKEFIDTTGDTSALKPFSVGTIKLGKESLLKLTFAKGTIYLKYSNQENNSYHFQGVTQTGENLPFTAVVYPSGSFNVIGSDKGSYISWSGTESGSDPETGLLFAIFLQ